MDVSHILDQLNDAQREAVTASQSNQLILAGAGSGKTRVLVHRIAWLIEVEKVSSWNILAVTFTNKAAREMRARIEQMLNTPAGAMWVGTFHGLAHRLLRAHWKEADLPQGFQILDAQDQQRLVRRVIKSMELDEARWPPRQLQWFINSCKDEGRRPQHIEHRNDPHIRLERRLAAHALKQPLLQDHQQLDLGRGGQGPHLVQENGPAVGDRVDVRRRHVATLIPDIAVSQIIREDDDEVGRDALGLFARR